MKIHETRTSLPSKEVIERARAFFTHAASPYAAFAERAGEGYIKLGLEVGEIVIGCVPQEDGSILVRGSASRGEHLLTRFLISLGEPTDARQSLHRRGLHRTRETRVDRFESETEPQRVTPAAA